MVGDRLSTDIRMALDAGMSSMLVLTGETRRQDLAGLAPADRPTYVLETPGRAAAALNPAVCRRTALPGGVWLDRFPANGLLGYRG